MKKLLLLILFIVPATYAAGWPTVSPEQRERNTIMYRIAGINEKFTAMGAYRSSGRIGSIVAYLQGLGTPVSYKIYQEMLSSGELRC